jgi:hypothetical protein
LGFAPDAGRLYLVRIPCGVGSGKNENKFLNPNYYTYIRYMKQIEFRKCLGFPAAMRIQKDLIRKGFELGKDFVVVRDKKNPKIFRISPPITLD